MLTQLPGSALAIRIHRSNCVGAYMYTDGPATSSQNVRDFGRDSVREDFTEAAARARTIATNKAALFKPPLSFLTATYFCVHITIYLSMTSSFQYYLLRIFRALLCAYQSKQPRDTRFQDFNGIFGKISRYQWDLRKISRFQWDFGKISRFQRDFGISRRFPRISSEVYEISRSGGHLDVHRMLYAVCRRTQKKPGQRILRCI